ncbi:hypothetical protein D9M73_100810 [compost metagenome]
MRDTTGELPHRLHLGRLCHFALEPRFLAIVLQTQQHRRIAEPARARDRQGHRFVGMVLQPHRKIGRMRRASGKAPDRIGDNALVFAHQQIAGIDGRAVRIDRRRPRKGIVHLHEAAIGPNQGNAERH